MKVRIGIGAGLRGASGPDLGSLVHDMEELRFDSLWLADLLSVPADDPLTALAYAAGAVSKLKIGTTMVLPGRNPVRLAKQIATLDRLSGGRLLMTFVFGVRLPAELAAMGVEAADRGALVDEVLPLLRRLWTEDAVEHRGPAYRLDGVTVEPKPLQAPFDVWLGGNVPSSLRRTGRLADGWLPSMCTPDEVAAGRRVIEQTAAQTGRAIDPEHYGVSIGYIRGDASPRMGRLATRRTDAELAELVPRGTAALRALIERYIEVGFSKFVVRPLVPPMSWRDELEDLAAGLLPLQV
ncbi:MAG: LLM class flavin-dependent oxidoreductase [Acidimicrobiales bacterium]